MGYHPGKPIIVEDHVKYNCTNCDDLFFFKNDLTKHLNLEHGLKNTKKAYYQNCKKSHPGHQTCGKDSNYYFTHKKGKRFPCNQCEKTYSTNVHLQSHIKTIHENCLDFECAQCGKKLGSHLKLK